MVSVFLRQRSNESLLLAGEADGWQPHCQEKQHSAQNSTAVTGFRAQRPINEEKMQLRAHLVTSPTLASTAVQIMSFESVSDCGVGLARDFFQTLPVCVLGTVSRKPMACIR